VTHEEPGAGGAHARVVIVDDHPMVRQIIAMACTRRPSLRVVGQAADGLEGLERCLELRPDVVVLDLGLPGLDGLEVLARARRALPSTRFLVISGRDDHSAVFESVRRGASGFLGKTGSVDEIAAAAEAVAQGTAVFSVAHQRAVRAELGHLVRRARESAGVAARLTRRQREILDLIARGLGARQMARQLGLSVRTVEGHTLSLYRKLQVRTRLQAIQRAAQMNLVDLVPAETADGEPALLGRQH
jgi:DNA-binding NarL/FixJ family response regulator